MVPLFSVPREAPPVEPNCAHAMQQSSAEKIVTNVRICSLVLVPVIEAVMHLYLYVWLYLYPYVIFPEQRLRNRFLCNYP